jgi:hypothetical protein
MENVQEIIGTMEEGLQRQKQMQEQQMAAQQQQMEMAQQQQQNDAAVAQGLASGTPPSGPSQSAPPEALAALLQGAQPGNGGEIPPGAGMPTGGM